MTTPDLEQACASDTASLREVMQVIDRHASSMSVLVDPAGRVVAPRMGDDGEELVQARPGQRPRRPALGQLADLGRRGPVELRVAAVRVDQDVRVDRDHKRSP